jgi:hypothetical protein
MREDRVGCGVSSNVNQLEAFFMRTLLTHRKSRISCQSFYIKAEGDQHHRIVNAMQSCVFDMKCRVFIMNTEYLWINAGWNPSN